MKRALINIDYTYDFVAVDGKLTCGKPGQDIEAQIVSLTKEFIKAGDFVAFGIDAHEEEDTYHPESALFPPHNIRGTSGKNYMDSLPRYMGRIKIIPLSIILKKRVIVLLRVQI